MAHLLGRDAEHGDLAAVAHVGEHVAEGGRVAGHFEARRRSLPSCRAVSGRRRVTFLRRRGPGSRPSSSRVRGGSRLTSVMTTKRAPAWRTTAAAMMPIGPAPVMSTSSPSTAKDKRGVDGVAEADRRWRRRRGRCRVDGARRWSWAGRCIRRTRPGRLTPTPLVWAHRWRRPARQFRQRPQTTCPSPLTISPGKEVVDVGADFDDLADELVADDHRHGDGLLRPGVPVVDVEVGAADAGAKDLDEHVVDADLRFRDVFQPKAGFGSPPRTR